MRYCSFIALLFPVSLWAQLQHWSSASFEHEVTPRWGYVLDVEHRADFNDYGNGEWLFFVGGNRQLTDAFDLAFGSRFQNGGPDGPNEIRFLTDLNYDQPIGETPFSLAARLRYQRDYPINSAEEKPTVALRPRIGLNVELHDNWTIFGEYEGRYRFDRRNEWSRTRFTTGLEVTVVKGLKVDVFYRSENRINDPESNRIDRIIGTYIIYTLPDERKRDWDYRKPFGRRILN